MGALTPVPYDPEVEGPMRYFIEKFEVEPLTAETIRSTRARFDAARTPIDEIVAGRRVEITDYTVPGSPRAPELVVSVIRRAGDEGAAAGNETRAPGIFSIHGGGMVTGHRFGTANELIGYVLGYGIVAATVEYRLAPESPHPGPVEDCYAALTWFAEHADELGVDRERLIVMGASAGGGLAAAVALVARDRGGPALRGQLLVCPMIDDRNDTISARQYPTGGGWDRSMNETGWRALLGDACGDPHVDAYAAPARATDLSGLPHAYIEVGAAEVFRDEDTAYASAIWAAGGQAELHVWAGGCHGFSELAPNARVSRAALAARRSWLERVLDLPSDSPPS